MDRIFLRLGPRAALGADSLQWILYRSQTKAIPPDLDLARWKGTSFVHSTKEILLRCIRERGLELDAVGIAGLEGLPDTFAEWKALHGAAQPAERAF